jgi:hypothetical protein
MYAKGKLLFVCGLIAGLVVFSTNHFVAGAEPREIINLNSLSNIYGPVLFDHAMHMDIGSCATCHHHTTGTGMRGEEEKCLACHKESCTTCKVACRDCHSATPETDEKSESSNDTNMFHSDMAGLKRAYHVNCLGCHREMEAATGCEDCHPKKEQH